MPVLHYDGALESLREDMDDQHDRISIVDLQRGAGAEVVLYIDNGQGIGGAEREANVC